MIFDLKDWDIDQYVELEEGSDDIIYRSYVEWNRFRDLEEENLLDYFDVSLPWEEDLSIVEYCNFINKEVFLDTSIINDWGLDDLKIVENDSHLSKIILRFPSRSDSNSDEIVSAIFDYYEVPDGTDYEYDLPDNLRYWDSMLKNDFLNSEYESYKKYPLTFIKYEKTVSDIQSKVNDSTDILTKKALILASFSISESLLKSLIVDKIPREDNISDFNNEILNKEIDKILRTHNKRNGIFKKLFNEKAPKQEWVGLRNSLAHDIESSIIQGEDIIYKNAQDDKDYTFKIYDLFQQQKDFSKELKRIDDTTNADYKT